MEFRPRDSQENRSPERSHQDSSPHRFRNSSLRDLGIDRNTYDQQASTSSGLNNDTRDESQKRFNVFLDEYRICLNDIFKCDKEAQNRILKMCKQEFQKSNESGRKQYVEELEDYIRKLQPDKYNDEEQVEIDKKLGYLLKNKDEELKNIRMSVLNFIEKKIENKSNKKEIFLNWTCEIDAYCTNHNELVTSNVYANVGKDMQLCYEANRYKRRVSGQNDNYKGQNYIVYKTIESFNESLYTEQERQQLIRQDNEQQDEQGRRDLLVQEQEMLQQQLGRDHRHDLHRQRTPEQRRELPNPEQRQIQRFRQIPEQWFTGLREQALRPTTISQIREYSEGLLQQVQRHNNPQERNEATLSQIRRQAYQLRGFLYPLYHPDGPDMGIRWDTGQNHEIEANLREVKKTMKDIMREFEKYDLHRVQTGTEAIPELKLKQDARELKQRMQRLLNEQGSRRSLERLRDEAHRLEEHAQWWSQQTIILGYAHYLESARKRASRIRISVDDMLRQNGSTGSQVAQELQEHDQQMRQIREQRRQQRPLQRRDRQMQQNHEQRHDLHRQRTPEQRRELPNPEQGQIPRSQQNPEQRLAELRQLSLRSMTISQIREYSEGLLQQVQRHRNPQERNEATLDQLRNEAHRLGQSIQYLNRPGARMIWDRDRVHEGGADLRRATETTRHIIRELQEYDQQMQQIREQSRQQRPLQRFKRRLWHILACGSPRLHEQRPDRQMQQNHEQRPDLHRQRTPEQSREQHRQRQRFTQQLLRILACGSPRQQEQRPDLRRQRTPEQRREPLNLNAMTEVEIKQYARELKQRMREHLNQQGSRRSLERLRDEAHRLEEHAQWRLQQTIVLDHIYYLRSAKKRASRIRIAIDNMLRQNGSTGS